MSFLHFAPRAEGDKLSDDKAYLPLARPILACHQDVGAEMAAVIRSATAAPGWLQPGTLGTSC